MKIREEKRLIPLAAFDVGDGSSAPADEPWPSAEGPADYRWLHLNLDDAQLPDWAEGQLPHIAAQALLQSETRPRCERYGDGLILNLRGVNLNERSDPEDMVSLRMWVTEKTIVSARKRKIWAMDDIRAKAEQGRAPKNVAQFLVDLTQGLTARIETVSLDLEDQTDALEEAVWDGEVPHPINWRSYVRPLLRSGASSIRNEMLSTHCLNSITGSSNPRNARCCAKPQTERGGSSKSWTPHGRDCRRSKITSTPTERMRLVRTVIFCRLSQRFSCRSAS